MKKILLVIFTILLFSPIYVNAATITETNYENGKITIKGTGDGELQLVLFDLEKNPLYLTTVTTLEGKFSITLPEITGLNEGTYTIKVADYEGKNVASETVEVKAEQNPPTGDNIILYIIIGGISLVGLIIVGLYFIYKGRKRKEN